MFSEEEVFSRTRLLVGDTGLERLSRARVMVVGLGGVGSYAAEAIARCGVGRLVLVDSDTVEASNLNRQLVALRSTLDQPKVEVAAKRYADIHPKMEVVAKRLFVDKDTIPELINDAEYIIDAIDSVGAKADLLAACHAAGKTVISCMGAANRLDPTGVKVVDIGQTKYCPLARVIRQRLKKRGIESGISCVYTEENRGVVVPGVSGEDRDPERPAQKARVQGSIAYVPGIIGLTAAGMLIQAIVAE